MITAIRTEATSCHAREFKCKNRFAASVAQLVELLICNQWVGGSSPFAGSSWRYVKLAFN